MADGQPDQERQATEALGSHQPGGTDAPATGRLFLTVAVLALGLALFQFVAAALAAPDALADWHAYYRSATKLPLGRDIYDEGKLLIERNSFDYWIETPGQYVYPPLLALLLTPLAARLTIAEAGVVWLVVLALATIGSLWALLRTLGRPLQLATIAPVAVPALACAPLLVAIRHGQVDPLLLLLLTLSLLAHQRGRDFLAGLALGTAAAVKPTLALYGLFYLRKRRWAALGAAAAAGATLGLGPFLALGPGALADWLAIGRYFAAGDYAAYPSNQSAHGFLLRAFAGGPRHAPLLASAPLAIGLWLTAIAGAAVLWWRGVSGRPERDERAALEFGLTGALILLAAPLSEDIHYVMLLTPLALLADRVAHGPWPRWAGWPALALASCLYFMQPWLDGFYYRGGDDVGRLLASGAYLYGLALVVASVAMLLLDTASRGSRRVAPSRADPTGEMRAARADPPGGASR